METGKEGQGKSMKSSEYWWYALVIIGDESKWTKCYKTYKGLVRHICRTYKGKNYYANIYIKPIKAPKAQV